MTDYKQLAKTVKNMLFLGDQGSAIRTGLLEALNDATNYGEAARQNAEMNETIARLKRELAVACERSDKAERARDALAVTARLRAQNAAHYRVMYEDKARTLRLVREANRVLRGDPACGWCEGERTVVEQRLGGVDIRTTCPKCKGTGFERKR